MPNPFTNKKIKKLKKVSGSTHRPAQQPKQTGRSQELVGNSGVTVCSILKMFFVVVLNRYFVLDQDFYQEQQKIPVDCTKKKMYFLKKNKKNQLSFCL